MLTAGAIVPHAPLLVEGVSGSTVTAAVAQTVEAMGTVQLACPELIVLLSPHGAETGVYRRPRGSLANFGTPSVSVDRVTDAEVATRLAEDWRHPVLESEADHGVVVPLRLLPSTDVPVVACTLRGGDPIANARRDAESLAAVLRRLADSRPLAFLASMNTSSALSARAPLAERPEGRALDAAILDRVSGERASNWVPDDMWSAGGSCGAGPFAAWMLLCAGLLLEEVSYESPFGVGYLVTVARRE